MELLLVKLVALIRPFGSIEHAAPLFEAVGVGVFGLLLAALMANSAVRKSLRLSGIDALIIAFTVWCVATSIIYFHAVRIGEVAKLLLPVLSYTIVKNVLSDRSEYRRFLIWALIGLAVPAVWSAVLIAVQSPTGVDMVNYWTQVTRWKGVYTHSHVLAHSMTLTLMALTVYVTVGREGWQRIKLLRPVERVFFTALALIALYCLYMSQVRSAILGLLVFALVYFLFNNRKLLFIGGVAAVVLAVSTVSFWYSAMLPEMVTAERGVDVKAMDIGSGRPNFWLNDLQVYGGLPFDQKLGGVGIGARGEYSAAGQEILGHSDWLEILTQTGAVGLLLFAALQIVILRRILRMEGQERYTFLALFLAVNFMMVVSNSYAWRIQVSQLYYMMLAFIELPIAAAVAKANEVPIRRVPPGLIERV